MFLSQNPSEEVPVSPVVKKLLAGFAATKAFEKVQEIRRPRQSFLRRHLGKILFVGLAGGAATYLYKNGKLDSLTGGGNDAGYRDQYPTGPGTEPITSSNGNPSLETSGV
jgi:hypothetical protein